MHSLDIFHREEEYVIGALRNVLLVVWHGPITVESIQRCRLAGLEMERRHPSGIGSMIVVREGVPMPEGPTRQAGQMLMREAGRWVRVSAMVIEGEGFWLSAARSVYTAMMLFSRQPFESKVFEDPHSASTWISSSFAGAPTAAELRAAFMEARRGLR